MPSPAKRFPTEHPPPPAHAPTPPPDQHEQLGADDSDVRARVDHVISIPPLDDVAGKMIAEIFEIFSRGGSMK
jgi:hypothetical protein